jgi:hypothetical protein
MRQTGFTADKEHSDDEVIWDDTEEDDDAGSNAVAEGSSATHGNDGSEELEDLGEPLSHSSKFLGPFSLRDWSEDDDDEPRSATALGGVALHVAAVAAAGAQAIPVVDMLASPEQPPVAPEPAASKPDDPEGAGSWAPRERSSRLRSSRLKSKRKRSRRRRACSLPG